MIAGDQCGDEIDFSETVTNIRAKHCEWPMSMDYHNFVDFVQQHGSAPLQASPFFGLMTNEEHKALLAQLLPVVTMKNDVRAFVVDANSSPARTSISKKLSNEQDMISLRKQQSVSTKLL